MTSDSIKPEALELMRSGVYIVTSAYRNQPAGCTCVWVTRVSFSPPLLAVYLEPSRHTFQAISSGKRFCINILGESSVELARRFGFTSGHETRKFDGTGYSKSPLGSPILDSAVSILDCKLDQIVEIGDHRMVTGVLTESRILSEETPLVYDPRSFYQGTETHLTAENDN